MRTPALFMLQCKIPVDPLRLFHLCIANTLGELVRCFPPDRIAPTSTSSESVLFVIAFLE